ncbi:serine protease [Rhodobacteraceae bacterium D3-12]|nr:serine protease [Rhodobacteraceae bacterium D3-12]
MAVSTGATQIENGLHALPYTVVKIEGESVAQPGAVSSGTGFFFRLDTKSGPILMIATNKHVVDDLDVLRFHMSLMDDNGKRILAPAETVDFSMVGYPVFRHPDPNVDLAMIPAFPVLDEIGKKGKKPYFLSLSRDNFPPGWLIPKLTAFTNVIMIGFPNGLMDVANNLPISRRGILSTLYFADHNGAKNFVVDIAAFGGSSGSPVLAYFEGMVPTADGGNTLGSSRIYLIGVLHSGPVFSAEGDVVPAPIPTSRQITKTSLMMHLGYCAKVSQLNDFVPLLEKYLADNPQAGRATSES